MWSEQAFAKLDGPCDTIAEWIYHFDFVQQLIQRGCWCGGVDCKLAELLDNKLVTINKVKDTFLNSEHWKAAMGDHLYLNGIAIADSGMLIAILSFVTSPLPSPSSSLCFDWYCSLHDTIWSKSATIPRRYLLSLHFQVLARP